MARTTPDEGLVNVYAVNVGSSAAARVAYRISEASSELEDALSWARKLEKIGRRLPYLWP